MTKRTPTVGIIGLGYGRAHIPAFQAHGCPVVAVCQRDATAARAVADAYGVPRVFTDWEELLDKARPEIVVVATPPHLHRPIALAAFAVGAHVLCEKPLALTRAEAETMVEAARRSGLIAMTGFNWRFPAAMQRLHAMVRAGAVGRPFHLSSRWFSPRWADASVPATWRMDRSQAGHGAMGDAGVHLIDLARWNFGEIVRVCAQTGIAYPSRSAPGGAPPDTEDYASVLARLASGALVTLAVSRVATGVYEHTLEAYGTDGSVAYRLGHDTPHWYLGELRAARADTPLRPVEVPADAVDTSGDASDIIGRATIAPLVARLLEGIATGRTPSPSFEDGLRAQAVLDAVLTSSRRGGWVDV